MRTRKITTGIVTVALLVALVGVVWAQLGPARAHLYRTVGDVKVQRGGSGAWLKVTKPSHHLLYGRDRIITEQRASCVVLIDGARISLGPATEVVIPGGEASSRVPRIITVIGKVFIWLIGGRTMELGSQAAIAAAEGTQFLVEVAADGAMVLTVVEGSVSFYNDLGRVTVGANEQSTATPGQAPTRPIRVDPSGYIDWEASVNQLWLNWETRFLPGETPQRLRELLDGAGEASADEQLRRGDLLHDLGRYTEAEAAYRDVLAANPDNADAQLHLGVTLLAQGRAEAARAALELAARLSPASAEPLVMLAAARASSARPENLASARATLDQATRLAADSPLAATLAGLLAMRAGDTAAARVSFERAVALSDDVYQAYAYLALVELAEGNSDAGGVMAAQAVELAPCSALAQESLATVRFYAGDQSGAREAAALALEINPASAGAHLLMSSLAVADGDLYEGLNEAQYAVTLDPGMAPAYSAVGMIYLALNDLRSAEKAFAHALEFSPELAAARTGMGATYARQGRMAEAMAEQKGAIALDAGRASTHNNMGAIHLALGDLDEALGEFDEAARRQPGWSMPLANKAIALLELNRFAEATAAAERAVALGERSGRAYTTLARCYLEQDREGKAWEAARRAVELDEAYALAHLELAEVYLRQDRARDALRHQLRAIAMSPAAIVQTREYGRTELTLEGGSAYANVTSDGRWDKGRYSWYGSATHERDDGDRIHTDVESSSVLGVVGRQNAAGSTDAMLLSWQRELRDRPGAELASGLPEDADYYSDFEAFQARYLARRHQADGSDLTVTLGWTDVTGEDLNPDSLLPDPKPFRRLAVEYEGPIAEARLDLPMGEGTSAIAGLALSGEDRTVSGLVGTPNPPGSPTPITWTAFQDSANRGAATGYLWYKRTIGRATEVMAGGRVATRRGASPVARPEAYLRHELSDGATLVFLTRPMLRDDVAEISPVMDWALGDWVSPLDLSAGGYSQSYELQYQLVGKRQSLLRLAGFHREMRNLIVDVVDPAWVAGQAGLVLASGTLTGGEIEWERTIAKDVTAGAWLRYTDSANDDAGGELPYRPDWSGVLRLDYMDEAGYRVGVRWLYVGERWADFANTVRLGSYDVVNLRAARQLNRNTDVFVTVENLLDEDYGMWQAYPAPGRRVRGGVQHRF
jgi:tetratricopeptide (TPR) repeat protein